MAKTLSFFEGLIFNGLYSFPNYLQGLFSRRPFWVSFWAGLQIDGYAVRFASRLRRKYGTKSFLTRVGGAKTVIVLDHKDIQHVLANSPRIYADSESKRKGMSHFQPNAVTISRGAEWEDRRRFNETVLNSGHAVHQYGDRFLNVICNATLAMQESAGPHLTWKHFDELFEQIAAGIIFGTDPHTARPLFDGLGKLMRESNRVFGLGKSKHFEEFYAGIRAQLGFPQPQSLAFVCSHTPSTDMTRVENQIPHWMFAMRDTLATNTARALALIVSHPDKERQVRDELVWSERVTSEQIRSLKYLEGCVQDAMRLWPTTPFLARECIVRDTLSGTVVEPGTQVLILNTFNHRDPEASADANQFCPEQWVDGPPDLPYNHLSSGTQVCAGKDLVLFISKAVLATLLHKGHYSLSRPSLRPGKPVPPMYNYFRLSFHRQ